jgi:hypothetical protein
LDLLQEIKNISRTYWPLAQSSHSSTSQAIYSEEGILGSPESFPLVGSILARFPEPFNGIREKNQKINGQALFDLYNPTEGSINSMIQYFFEDRHEQLNPQS